MGSAESHKDDQRSGTSLLQRMVEGAAVIHPEEEKPSWRPHCGFPVLQENIRRMENNLFTQSDSDGTRGNNFKLKEWRFRFSVRRKFFTQKMVRLPRLPREFMNAPSLVAFKVRWDELLGNIFQ